MVKNKLISSLEKVFPDEKIDKFDTIKSLSVLKGERFSFQLIHTNEAEEFQWSRYYKVEIKGALAPFATARDVSCVPVTKPINPHLCDDNHLRTTPGVYPDVLMPLHYRRRITTSYDILKSVWIEVDLPEDAVAGDYEIEVDLIGEEGDNYTHALKVEIIDAALPEQTLKYTDWFHCDCLADYYELEMWSEEHWRVIENFMRAAKRAGINLILTPVFTPALDTARGAERRTTQLVGIKLDKGEYSFDFSLLERWIELCNKIGIKYFEICHFFTQWGAEHAPKVMATVDGEYKRIFGWETEASGEEYSRFIRTFIVKFLEFMKARGDDGRCFFHISDEPNARNEQSYAKAKAVVADLLKGYPIMDAISDYEYYENGLVETPIPINNKIKPFIEHGTKGLWTYFACNQSVGVANRFLSMPLWRARSLGMQMYKYDIVGFLHWGFNFYNNRLSGDPINPYINQDGDDWVPAGDMFIVYPAPKGEVYESIRVPVFYDGLQDMRAMSLCEKYYPKEEIIAGMEKILGSPIAFDKCARSAKEMLAIREYINTLIKNATKK